MNDNSMNISESGETIVYSTKRHWAILLPPFFLLVFAGLSIPSKGFQAWVLVIISLAWVAVSWMNFQTARFRLTKTRLLTKTGFPFPGAHDIPLETIRTADVYQPVLGKFLDFGKLCILLSGGNKEIIRMVRSPHLMASAIGEYKTVPAEEQRPGMPG